ncbi:MAG: FGGY-family carbohydrate kinase [Cyanobacteria bacterium J06635_15]
MGYSLGIDFGTSGARAIAIDAQNQPISEARQGYGKQPLTHPGTWRETLMALLASLPLPVRAETKAIAVNGTSATVLLCDSQGSPVREALLYDDSCGKVFIEKIRRIAPEGNPALSVTSALAKLLWWCDGDWDARPADGVYFMHQADWLGWLLHGQLGISDYHNALKLGYDVGALRYPAWLADLSIAGLLPQVVAPGDAIAPIMPTISQQFQFPSNCQVCAGTTDSIAAFLASGAQTPGDGVTSLGSTLVIKLLSETRVDDSRYGIYSHRLGDLWLVGGASNSGGAVLHHFFSDYELAELSAQISCDQPSALDYYPLLKPGERFPINDPLLPPRLSPRPDDAVQFLHGLLEGISRIEALGYHRLIERGATVLQRVCTAGGGSHSVPWQTIRQRILGVPVTVAQYPEAAYGTALLARGHTIPEPPAGINL